VCHDAKTRCDRVTARAKDDGYAGCRRLRRPRYGDGGGYDYGWAAADEIGSEHQQSM
jgi:hypothetical protein